MHDPKDMCSRPAQQLDQLLADPSFLQSIDQVAREVAVNWRTPFAGARRTVLSAIGDPETLARLHDAWLENTDDSAGESCDSAVAVRTGALPADHRPLVLFLAASPRGNSLELEEECAAIRRELQPAHKPADGVDLQFAARWAVTVEEMMRHLAELEPTIVHFSGHGGASSGLLLQNAAGRPEQVSKQSLATMFDMADRSPRVVMLNACYSEAQATALHASVDVVVGMDSVIGDHAARTFAMRFYAAINKRRSVGSAVAQGFASLAAKRLPDEILPHLLARDGIDPRTLVVGRTSAIGDDETGASGNRRATRSLAKLIIRRRTIDLLRKEIGSTRHRSIGVAPDDIDASTAVEGWRSLPERDPRVQLEIQQLGVMVQNALVEFAMQGSAQQRQAQLLRRRVLDEVSYSELGAELQCTESALRVRVHKATQAFRKHLRECHPEMLPERARDASASA